MEKNEARLLLQAITAITETLSLDERLNQILEQLEQVIPCESAVVQLLHDNYLEIVSGRGQLDIDEIIGIHFPIPGDNPNTTVIQSRKPLLLPDTTATSYGSFTDDRFQYIKSWLGLPLIVHNEVIGILALDNIDPTDFTSDHMNLAVTFAGHVAIAIENARLFQKTQQQAQQLNHILEASTLLHRGLNLQQVLTQIVEGTQKLGFRIAVMNLYDPETDTLTVQAMAGATEQERELLSNTVYQWSQFAIEMKEKFRISQSYFIRHDEVTWSKETHGVMLIPDMDYKGPGYWHPYDAMFVPLYDTHGARIGVISVDEPIDERVPTLDTIRMVEAFANQAAIALENARLHAQAQRDTETKAMLLREVNHRVQNNLNTILGLISIEQHQSNLKNHPAYQTTMQNLTQRIQGFATVHRMLSSTQWSPLSLSNLVKQVINSVLAALPAHQHVTVYVTDSFIFVGAKYANNLALILNELTTNTIKYAMPHRTSGRITVNICDEGETILLEYRDDGPGYPAETLQLHRHNVGLQLLQFLVEKDLKGRLALSNDAGAVTTIRFTPDHTQPHKQHHTLIK